MCIVLIVFTQVANYTTIPVLVYLLVTVKRYHSMYLHVSYQSSKIHNTHLRRIFKLRKLDNGDACTQLVRLCTENLGYTVQHIVEP